MTTRELDVRSATTSPPVVWTLITTYNRKETTLRGLASLYNAANCTEVDLRVVVTDDNSPDGTADFIERQFPNVNVLHGNGNLFWAKGMALAEDYAYKHGFGDADFIFWFNDDVILDPNSISKMLETASNNPHAVIVGSTRWGDDQRISYAGYKRRGIHPLSFELVSPDPCVVTEVETFNGNAVLIPGKIATAVGRIENRYAHAFSDFDYSNRCREAGFPLLLAPGTVGVCPRNPEPPELPLIADWRRFISPKGVHPKSTQLYLRRFGGRTWPVFWASTYVLWWVRKLVKVVRNG